jgi:hypothetical protein
LSQVETEGGIFDAQQEMSSMVEDLALNTENGLTANDIANEVNLHFARKYAERAYEFLKIETMRSMVYRYRQREFGEWEGLIMVSHPTSCVTSTDTRLFIQFNINVNIEITMEKVNT